MFIRVHKINQNQKLFSFFYRDLNTHTVQDLNETIQYVLSDSLYIICDRTVPIFSGPRI